jgi:SAM-dependent methyltransferase
MDEIWETTFKEKQTMWGFEPAVSAVLTMEYFLDKNIRNILIPGIGYGRNAKIFIENGINVTGIEISKTAIDLAKTENKLDIKIHHGSVSEMPFDNNIYDGIFCHGLIYLLDESERNKLIKDCYNQLKPNGYMIFTVISKNVPMYGTGKQLGKDRFEIFDGIKMFFYDSKSVKQEFGKYGLTEFSEIDEPNMDKTKSIRFILVKCKKTNID